MATTSALPSQEIAPLSEVQRILNVFFSPSKTFADPVYARHAGDEQRTRARLSV